MKKTATLFSKIILISLVFLNGGKIFGMVPVPIVNNMSYCMGAMSGQIDESIVNVDPVGGYNRSDFELRWYGAGVTPSNTYSITAPTPITTFAGITTYWVSQYNKVTAEESDIISFEITVYPLPITGQITATPAVICEGTTVELQVTGHSSDVTLTWNDNTLVGNSIQTGTTVQARPVYTGGSNHRSTCTYTVTIISNNVGCASTNTVQVEVDEPLNAQMEDKNICEGDRVTLDASPYQATSYVWVASTDIALRYGSTLSERPEATTTYYVAMERGECTANDEIIVTVNSNPRILRIDSIDVKAREIIAMEGFGTPPFIYAVDDQPFDFDPFKYDLLSGMHTFRVIDLYGCQSQAYVYVMGGTESSNSSVPVSVIKTYPNPFTDKLKIEKAANYHLTVTNMQGRIQYQRANLTDNETILTSGWVAGTYFITISSQDNHIVKKVVKY